MQSVAKHLYRSIQLVTVKVKMLRLCLMRRMLCMTFCEKRYPSRRCCCSRNLSAVRRLRAMMVRAGFTLSALGKVELSEM